jgi:hypothetical protein
MRRQKLTDEATTEVGRPPLEVIEIAGKPYEKTTLVVEGKIPLKADLVYVLKGKMGELQYSRLGRPNANLPRHLKNKALKMIEQERKREKNEKTPPVSTLSIGIPIVRSQYQQELETMLRSNTFNLETADPKELINLIQLKKPGYAINNPELFFLYRSQSTRGRLKPIHKDLLEQQSIDPAKIIKEPIVELRIGEEEDALIDLFTIYKVLSLSNPKTLRGYFDQKKKWSEILRKFSEKKFETAQFITGHNFLMSHQNRAQVMSSFNLEGEISNIEILENTVKSATELALYRTYEQGISPISPTEIDLYPPFSLYGLPEDITLEEFSKIIEARNDYISKLQDTLDRIKQQKEMEFKNPNPKTIAPRKVKRLINDTRNKFIELAAESLQSTTNSSETYNLIIVATKKLVARQNHRAALTLLRSQKAVETLAETREGRVFLEQMNKNMELLEKSNELLGSLYN